MTVYLCVVSVAGISLRGSSFVGVLLAYLPGESAMVFVGKTSHHDIWGPPGARGGGSPPFLVKEREPRPGKQGRDILVFCADSRPVLEP